jgi:hypothetical protein
LRTDNADVDSSFVDPEQHQPPRSFNTEAVHARKPHTGILSASVDAGDSEEASPDEIKAVLKEALHNVTGENFTMPDPAAPGSPVKLYRDVDDGVEAEEDALRERLTGLTPDQVARLAQALKGRSPNDKAVRAVVKIVAQMARAKERNGQQNPTTEASVVKVSVD